MAFLITGSKIFVHFARNGHQAPPPTLQIMSTHAYGEAYITAVNLQLSKVSDNSIIPQYLAKYI